MGASALWLFSMLFRGDAVITATPETVATRNYREEARRRLLAASTSNDAALGRYQSSWDEVITKHRPRLDAMTQAATSAATERMTLYPMLVHLASDQVRNTHGTDAFLQGRIGQTTVDPVLQAFLDDLAVQADRIQAELDKETVKLAYDLAAPGHTVAPVSLRGKVRTDFASLFMKPARDAGTEGATVVLVFAFFDAPAIARIANKVFAKQVARLVAAGTLALLDGPSPVGDAIFVISVAWAAWDLHELDAEFKQEVSASLTDHFSRFRDTASREARDFGSKRWEVATQQQKDIAASATGPSLLKGMP
ncbi:hypothetical protein [Variovorax sp. LjRoot178]|uniref:hypothetical protein n=1 Tax=Variovorax sp. LjRoot178 TaxID=3342277 RepID=UPI003ECF6E90